MTCVTMSKDLVALLLYLLDVQQKTPEESKDAVRVLLTGRTITASGGALNLSTAGVQGLVQASKSIWTLIAEAEEHIMYLGELHIKDGKRLLAEIRRLLIQRGVYRPFKPCHDRLYDFALNGERWVLAHEKGVTK